MPAELSISNKFVANNFITNNFVASAPEQHKEFKQPLVGYLVDNSGFTEFHLAGPGFWHVFC